MAKATLPWWITEKTLRKTETTLITARDATRESTSTQVKKSYFKTTIQINHNKDRLVVIL